MTATADAGRSSAQDSPSPGSASLMDQVGQRARSASLEMAQTRSDLKDRALHAMAEALERSSPLIIEANQVDVNAGHEAGLSSTLLDRLVLTKTRIGSM